MRPITSLCYHTDLFLAGFHGEVHWRDRYVVIRTPSNPGSFWGNILLYPEPPDARAAAPSGEGSWLEDHTRELPGVKAQLFAWDRPDGAKAAPDATRAFVDLGFEPDESVVLTATRVSPPPRVNDDVEVAPITTDADWRAAESALTAAFATNGRSGTPEDVRVFVERQLVLYRAIQERGSGQWYAGRLGGETASVLGLVRVERGGGLAPIGRFQLIGTDPRFARRGACSTLLHEVSRRGLEEQGLATLVVAADATYHSARVYESVGFQPTEHLGAFIRKPPAA